MKLIYPNKSPKPPASSSAGGSSTLGFSAGFPFLSSFLSALASALASAGAGPDATAPDPIELKSLLTSTVLKYLSKNSV